MKKLTALLVSTSTTAALAVGLAPAPAQADPDGIRERQLDRLTQQVVEEGAIGVTARVVTPDGTWSDAAGKAERSTGARASADAAFRAASVSKQVLAVLALQLVDRGTWSLDTTLGDVLPTVWPERSSATVRQMLSHTSGIPEYLVTLLGTDPSTSAFKKAISPRRSDADLVAAAKASPVVSQPGEFGYANTNYVLVGMMLEEQTGRSLDRLARERVFDPAGMDDSSFPRGKQVPRPRLQEYGRLYGDVVSLASFSPTMFSGAGALLTTTQDLVRFQRALSHGDLIPRSLVRTMRTPVTGGGATGLQYGLGSYRLPDPCKPGRWVHGHDGGSWGTFTLTLSSPRGERRAAVAMTGRDYDGDNGAPAAMLELATVAMAQTCGGEPRVATGTATGSGATAPLG